MREKYWETIKSLISCEEWHFNASHSSENKLKDIWIEDMIVKMKELAPASVVPQIAFFHLHNWKKWQKGTKVTGWKSHVATLKKIAAFYVAQGQEKPEKLLKVMKS